MRLRQRRYTCCSISRIVRKRGVAGSVADWSRTGYTHEILTDSLVYAEYAGRNGHGGVELGDVEMAISCKANHQFSLAPPKEVGDVSGSSLLANAAQVPP